jgi:hypothetical protein
MNDGKTPFLGDFARPIAAVVAQAAGKAYRAMVKPPRRMTIKSAAWEVMEQAYLAASENVPGRDGPLPAKARQVMYAARPDILRMTGAKSFTDGWFTQHLLPDYVTEYPRQTADWLVVFDARGEMREPHTRLSLGLGTSEVDDYTAARPARGPAARLSSSALYPTMGPENRFKTILYIEKEGFAELFEAAEIQERFDVMVMSNKGCQSLPAANCSTA